MSNSEQADLWLSELLRMESGWLNGFLARQSHGRCLRVQPIQAKIAIQKTVENESEMETKLDAWVNSDGFCYPFLSRIAAPATLEHSFETVVLQHVLDTQDAAAHWLANAMTWVKPGGRLVLMNFNRFSAWHLLGRCESAFAAKGLQVNPRIAARDRALLLRHDFVGETVQHLGTLWPQIPQTAQAHYGWLSRYRAVHVVSAIKRSGQVISMRDLIAKRKVSNAGFALTPSTRVSHRHEAA